MILFAVAHILLSRLEVFGAALKVPRCRVLSDSRMALAVNVQICRCCWFLSFPEHLASTLK